MIQKIKTLVLVTNLFLFANHILAQQTGLFQRTIVHNSQNRILEYAVPSNYVSTNNYPLVVGLQGCVNPSGSTNLGAVALRNDLAFLADSINAIVVCPTGLLNNQGGFMDNPDNAILLAAIDSTIDIYNIDTTSVYLAGFSCNGYTTVKYGTNALYPWKGLIPIHPALPSIVFSPAATAAGLFDYQTNIPTCLCIGGQDPGLSASQQLRDSFVTHGTPHYYNEIPGVGHTTQFVTLKEEVMECFNYFNTLLLPTRHSVYIDMGVARVYPNPSLEGKIMIEASMKEALDFMLYDIRGRLVRNAHLVNETTSLQVEGLEKGVYFWSIIDESKNVSRGKVILQ